MCHMELVNESSCGVIFFQPHKIDSKYCSSCYVISVVNNKSFSIPGIARRPMEKSCPEVQYQLRPFCMCGLQCSFSALCEVPSSSSIKSKYPKNMLVEILEKRLGVIREKDFISLILRFYSPAHSPFNSSNGREQVFNAVKSGATLPNNSSPITSKECRIIKYYSSHHSNR